MTEPCRPSCPAGDCAGCAFPPARAMCDPSSYCSQHRDCARRVTSLCSATEQHVDGTVLRHPSGAWCPIFIDSRTAALEFA
jgi:hypothetical protein